LENSTDGGALQKAGQAVRFDPLNPDYVDLLRSLSDEQRSQLLVEYARGSLDVAKKAAEMHVDVNGFKNMLDVMAAKTRDLAAQEGTSVTLQHTHESSVGRTEVIMGNTEQAAKGRLTRTMAGERNLTALYVVVGIIATLILVSMFVRR